MEELVARRLALVRGGAMARRMRPLSPRQSFSSTAVTSGSGRPVHSARSEAGCAIFVFERRDEEAEEVGGDLLLARA